MGFRLLIRLVLAASLLIGGVPAVAAPTVAQISQAPVTSHYDEAARELGFPEWGETIRSEAVVHLIIRLNLRDTRIGLCIPRSVPARQAEIWLQRLSDAMEWKDVELTSSRQPYGTMLSAVIHKNTRPAGLGRQQVRMDLPRLRTELARLTPLPLQIAVRTPTQEQVPSTPAAAQGTWKKMRYIFFRDPGPTAKPLTLTYGMGRRWQVAMSCAWLAWALFPSLAFYAVREQQLRNAARTPRERWNTYRRWLKPVWVVTIAGMVVTPFVLSLQGVAFLLAPFGTTAGSLMFPGFMIMSAWVVVPQQVIGFSLSRELSERQQKQRYSEVVRNGVLALVVLTALVPALISIPIWIDGLPQGRSTDPPSLWSKVALSLLFLSPLLIGLSIWVSSTLRWRRRATGLLPGDVEVSAEVSLRVRDLTATLATPIRRVLLVSKGDAERQRGAAVSGEMATVLNTVAERLRPDQLAGLISAELLGVGRGWKAHLPGGLGIALFCLGLGSLCWMFLSSSNNTITPSTTQMLPVVLGIPLALIPLFIDHRLRRQRQDQADLLVADALGDPSTFLDALRTLETVQMEASHLDPALVPVPATFTERRRRLERRLGLE